MMRCAAIDDEPLALKQISGYIARTPFLTLAAAYPGAMEAVGDLAEREVDLLFADIDMPGLSGLEFVRSLAAPPMVVFTTAYSEYAVEGFRLDATDYLLKPIGYPDFVRAAERAHRRWRQAREAAAHSAQMAAAQVAQAAQTVQTTALMADDPHANERAHAPEFATVPALSPAPEFATVPPPASESRLFVKSEYRTVPVEIGAIDHIESMGEYMRIHVEGGAKPVTTLGSLRSMAERLPRGAFMRIHRTYLVNLSRIAAVERGVIVTAAGARIPVGEQYRDEFRAWLDRNSFSK